MARLVIADDHGLLRSGLARLLGHDHEIVGDTGNEDDTVRVDPDLRITAPPARAALTPRESQVMSLLAHGNRYRDIGAQLRLGERTIETYRRRIADKLGVRSRAELVAYALRHGWIAGRTYVDAQLAVALDHEVAVRANLSLSERERDVLIALARGRTYKAIADQLGVGVRTIETYRRRVVDKLGLRSRADFLRYALELGWVDRS